MTDDPGAAIVAAMAAEEELYMAGANAETLANHRRALTRARPAVDADEARARRGLDNLLHAVIAHRLREALADPAWTAALVDTWPCVPTVRDPDKQPRPPAPARITWSPAAIAELYHGRLPADPIGTFNRLLGLPPDTGRTQQ